METTVQQIVDYVRTSHRDLSITLKVTRQEYTMWVYDFTTLTGAYVSDLRSLAQELIAKRQANLEEAVKELQQNGYEVTRP